MTNNVELIMNQQIKQTFKFKTTNRNIYINFNVKETAHKIVH